MTDKEKFISILTQTDIYFTEYENQIEIEGDHGEIDFYFNFDKDGNLKNFDYDIWR